MQLNARSQSTRSESFLIPFNSRPVAPLQDHALTLGQEPLGKSPQLPFETDSKLVGLDRFIRCGSTNLPQFLDDFLGRSIQKVLDLYHCVS